MQLQIDGGLRSVTFEVMVEILIFVLFFSLMPSSPNKILIPSRKATWTLSWTLREQIHLVCPTDQHTSFVRENLEFVVCFSSIYRLVLKENLRRKQIEGMF